MNRADTSIQSIGSQPDLSFGSFASGFSTPARNPRVASGSTAASSAPVSTPSPPTAAQFARRRFDDPTPKRRGADDANDADPDVLDTPGQERRWVDVDGTPAPKRGKGAAGKGSVNLTLRDQEKVRVSMPPARVHRRNGRRRCAPSCVPCAGTAGCEAPHGVSSKHASYLPWPCLMTSTAHRQPQEGELQH